MKKKVTTKKKLNTASLVLIIGIIIIMIPVVVLIGIIISAQNEGSTPIYEQRIKNERSQEISNSQVTSLEKSIEALDEIESCSIELKVSTLRINVDVKDSLKEEDYPAMFEKVYQEVDKNLAINTYFTSNGSEKNYDLEIHAYNNLDKIATDEFLYLTLVKNGSNTGYVIDVNTTAKNDSLAKELRGETTSTGDVTGEGDENPENNEGGE